MLFREAFVAGWSPCVCLTIVSLDVTAATSAGPNGGTTRPLPGTIQAANFDGDGTSAAYFDTVKSERVFHAAPAVPTVIAPLDQSNGVAVSTSLAWSANRATTYDLKFGTTNPPPTAATGLTVGRYTPGALTKNTTYYWQVVARNATGATVGPVWSFTTIAAALSTPTLVAPADHAQDIALTGSLAWSAI